MRRGFQPPADLWGSVGDFGDPNVRSTGCISLWRICHQRVKMEKLVKLPKNMR
ncbi:hypothetical protein Osc7112_4996 [Oscillatoria nigro-viridis PCC 7112]|uniref:Uncharacterized protein n=1 Tax=Phormidium nigroviride PCC 7112 TaxID=179408 RepID=K9VP51_9CYAN|nr:hypothetical protein Osc7112_4996 [Oscillatoria nigro-viridis PCC 7112]